MEITHHGDPDQHPDAVPIVGVEADPRADGGTRVYIGNRELGLHTHVNDAEALEQIRAALGSTTGVVTTRVPIEVWCSCDCTLAQRVAIEMNKDRMRARRSLS